MHQVEEPNNSLNLNGIYTVTKYKTGYTVDVVGMGDIKNFMSHTIYHESFTGHNILFVTSMKLIHKIFTT